MEPMEQRGVSGPGAAALIGVGVGVLALGMSHLFSEASEAWKTAMQQLGNLWMPGAAGIGPYSGKETVSLLVWLTTWGLLHLLWRKREISFVMAGAVMLGLIGVATTILWPPIIGLLLHA